MSTAANGILGKLAPGATDAPNGLAALDETLKIAPSLVAREAERLLAAGFWPVPLYAPGVEREGKDPTKGKEPFGKGWGAERHTAESLKAAYRNKQVGGVGIALGPGRAPGGGWLIDVEGDGPEAEESRLKLFGGEVVETKGWGSARGLHALHTIEPRFLDLMQRAGAVEGKGKGGAGVLKIDALPGLEFRIGGAKPGGEIKQAQSACPPTLGTDGLPRAWSGAADVATLPGSAYEFMEALAEAKEERAAIQAEYAAAPAATQPATFRTPVTGPLDKIARARLYAAKLDPAVSGQAGHSKAFRAACRIGPGFDLSIDETLSVLEAWNQTCVPPWSPAELRHKVEDAFKVNTLPPGFLLNEPPKNGSPAAASARPLGKPTAAAIDYGTMSDADLGIVNLRDVREGAIDWLWPYRVAKGEMTIVAGEGGLGKSQLLLSTAAAVSRGLEWADKSGFAPVGRTIILAAEDSPETTIKPRLLAMGADVDKITIIKAKVTIPREGKPPEVSFMSLQDLAYWQAVLGRLPDTSLFIIDPLASYLGRNVNDSKNNEIRAILEPFIEQIIRPAGVCLLTNAHLNKNVDLKSPTHRINGSVAYANLARNVHFVVRDPGDPTHRIFTQAKCNNAPDGLPGVGFRIEGRTLDGPSGPIETAIPIFDDAPLANVDLPGLMSGDKGTTTGISGAQQATRADECAQVVADYLWSRGVGVQVRWGDLLNVCGEKGYAGTCDPKTGYWSNRAMLNRAIERFNDVEHKPSGMERFEIVRVTDSPDGSGKAKAFYLNDAL